LRGALGGGGGDGDERRFFTRYTITPPAAWAARGAAKGVERVVREPDSGSAGGKGSVGGGELNRERAPASGPPNYLDSYPEIR